MISVVCPFFNEEKILDTAVCIMLKNLQRLSVEWELVIVNDGSTDNSPQIARKLAEAEPGLRMVGYERNLGRGNALMTGIRASRGDIIVTTEIDCSWGDDIVDRLLAAMHQNPKADIVVASPHLPGGGYKNVPLKRVFFSTVGNMIIRTFFTYSITMNTGMTRAYRREIFDKIDTVEKGKEFHLEVLLKAMTFRFNIIEIPCILEWRDLELAACADAAPRKSSSKVGKIVRSHIGFSLFANPIRYFWFAAAMLTLLSFGFFVSGTYRYFTHNVAIYMLLCSMISFIVAIMFFGFGLMAAQHRMLERDLWRMQAKLTSIEKKLDASADKSETPE